MEFNYSSKFKEEVANDVISSIADLPLQDRLELLREIEHRFAKDKKISNSNIDETTG